MEPKTGHGREMRDRFQKWQKARIVDDAPDSVLYAQLRRLSELDELWVLDRPDLKTRSQPRRWCCINAVPVRGGSINVPTKHLEMQAEFKAYQEVPRPVVHTR